VYAPGLSGTPRFVLLSFWMGTWPCMAVTVADARIVPHTRGKPGAENVQVPCAGSNS
jgi:hypothetical protein